MNIGIDVDGVLVDMEGYQLKHGTEYFKKVHNKSVVNPTAYDIEQIFECTHEEREKFWRKYIWAYCLKEPVMNNATEVIARLRKKGHKIFIITSRAHTTEHNLIGVVFRWMLKYWLKKNHIVYDSLIYCSERDSSSDKYKVCVECNVDVMIDDKLENLIPLVGKIIPLCYSAAWNRNAKDNNLFLVNDWNHIYTRILEFESVL